LGKLGPAASSPFPCLYYVDSSGYGMKHIERSGALLPSEFIDRDLLKEQRKQLLDEKVTSGTGEKANNSSAGEPAAPSDYFVNLERHTLAPYTGFQVREGDDFDDAIRGFSRAHAKNEKPLTWYGCGKETLTAKDVYVVSARDAWQKIADEWIPDGTIKISVEEVKQPEKDGPVSDQGLFATRGDDEDDQEGEDEGNEDTENDKSNAEDDVGDEEAGNFEDNGSDDAAGNYGSTQIEHEIVTQVEVEAWWTSSSRFARIWAPESHFQLGLSRYKIVA
jgi:hypothetical protein